MKEAKKFLALLLALALVSVMFAGCAKTTTESEETTTATEATEAPVEETTEAPAEETTEETAKPKIALVANQRFGDGSSIDQMLEGLQRVSADYNLDYTTLESLDEANYYDDLAALCEEGCQLIITTFSFMSEAVMQCAKDYPDVKFVGLYQNIEGYDNIYTTNWQTQKGLFIAGILAASMSTDGHVGFILGAEEPSANAEANGFMQGVKWANPDAQVEFIYNNSYEDVDSAKTKAEAMIAVGCDVIGTDIGAARVGVYEAAQEAGDVLVIGDTSYNLSEGYEAVLPACWVVYFDVDLYNAVEKWATGNWQGGSQVVGYDDGIMAYSDEATANFKAAVPDKADAVDAAWTKVDEALAQIESGALTVEFITDTPDWAAILAR